MKRSQLPIALSMLAVFLSGSLVGALAHRLYSARTVYTANDRRSPNEYRQRYLTEMKTRLNLDETQTARLSEALDRTRQRFRDFNEKHKPEIASIHDEQVREIRGMLNADQQERYEQYLKEREQKRRDHEKGGK